MDGRDNLQPQHPTISCCQRLAGCLPNPACIYIRSHSHSTFTLHSTQSKHYFIQICFLVEDNNNIMESEYSLIKQLRPFLRRNWKILVRVERLWEVYQLGKTTSTSLSLILIDKSGGMVHASVPSDHFAKYKEQLNEHDVVAISNFLVESKDRTYCPLNMPYKIKFRADTKVQQQTDTEPFPKQTFTFTSFEDLDDKVDKTIQLIDVAGLFVRVEKTSTKLKTRSGESDKQDVFVRNESGDEMRIAFWGKNLDHLLPLLEAAEQKTVLIMTSLIAKRFNDKIYLQATYGTKIYIDSEIPQATALLNSPQKPSTKRRLFDENKTIEEIITLAVETTEPFRANCVATISKVYTDEGFYYDACPTCKAGVNKDMDNYWCYNCKKLLEEPTARLRIKFQIEDETGQKDVSTFEENAQNLSGKSLDDFMDLSVEFAGQMAVKDALEEILDRKLSFEIKVGSFNLERPDFPFTVSKFTDLSDRHGKRIKQEQSA